MRVLIVFNHPAPYKVKIFNELSKYVDLTVLFERTRASDRPEAFYRENDYKFNTLFIKSGYVGNEGSISNKVRKYIKEHHQEFDVIIMNGYSHVAEMKAIKYMVKNNIKFGLMINGGIANTKEFILKKLLKKKYISSASYYLSSLKESNKYLEYYGSGDKKIYNYVYSNFSRDEVIDKPIKDKDELRKQYDLPLGKKLFVSASQFIERKNNVELISLFKGRDDVLVLYGEGHLKEQYESYIIHNKIDNVILRPFVDKTDLFEIFKAADAYITLSRKDIFGHTILEAFACGLPVISSDNVESAIEFIENGKNGFLVNLDNENHIKECMDKISQDMSQNAIDTAKHNTFEEAGKTIYEALKEEYGK